jgi:hypothetical protein
MGHDGDDVIFGSLGCVQSWCNARSDTLLDHSQAERGKIMSEPDCKRVNPALRISDPNKHELLTFNLFICPC